MPNSFATLSSAIVAVLLLAASCSDPAGNVGASAMSDGSAGNAANSLDGSADASRDGGADDTATGDAGADSGFTECPAPVPGTSCKTVGDACAYAPDDADVSGVCACRSEPGESATWTCYSSCPLSVPAGSCDAGGLFEVGLTCSYPADDGGSTVCSCLSASGGASQWKCGAPPDVCPATPAEGTPCSGGPGGADAICSYPNEPMAPTDCRCEAAGVNAGSRWICNSVSCAASPPLGACSDAVGLSCKYNAGSSVCICGGEDSGSNTWSCNGKPAPACPATPEGDCSMYPQGAICAHAGATGGSCVCGGATANQWQCSSG